MAFSWKLLVETFVAVFVAELGDKTQLATVTLASERRAWLPVLVGAGAALLTSTVIAVAVGSALGRYVPESIMKRVAGGIFIVLGVLYLVWP